MSRLEKRERKCLVQGSVDEVTLPILDSTLKTSLINVLAPPSVINKCMVTSVDSGMSPNWCIDPSAGVVYGTTQARVDEDRPFAPACSLSPSLPALM
jgi:hypothetical protein